MTASPVVSPTVSAQRRSVGFATGALVLAARNIQRNLREGPLVFAAFSPVVFFTCFYVPMHSRFERIGIDYAQFIVPVIIVQAAIFTAMGAAEAGAVERREGMRERIASLPIARLAPLAGRMATSLVRILLAAVIACLFGALFGFRFEGGAVGFLGFVALPMILAFGLSLLTDAVANVVGHPDSIAQMLMVPQLVLVMVSTGFMPAEAFPDWIQPVVRNQPVSLIADTMRGLAEGTEITPLPVVLWIAGILLAGVVLSALVARKETSR